MEYAQAIVLGIVEGLTEFLPVSSTGHLIVAQEMLGFYDASKMFTIVIQMGAILAVMWFYRRQLWDLTRGLLQGNAQARRFWMLWIVATIPAGVLGILFEESLERYVTTTMVALALLIGGILIWLIETYHTSPPPKKEPQLDRLTLKQVIAIGFYQTLALIPGVSRSGATIMGGVLSGLDRVTATAFSFYLGIPVLLLAGIYKLATDKTSTIDGGSLALLLGCIASFITALVVVGWLLRYVSRHDFKPFAYYRIVVGLVLLALIASGFLD